MAETEDTKQVSPEMDEEAREKARDRAKAGRWDLDIAVFLFGILIIVIILLFEKVRIEIVAPIAAFGLAMVWVVGWRRGKQLFQRFYDEEILKLKREQRKTETVEETIEERVQKALRERWK